MNAPALQMPQWSSRPMANAAHSALHDLRTLGAHIERCNGCRGRWFAVRCAADAVHDFIAPRFVTTLMIAAAVIGVAALMS